MQLWYPLAKEKPTGCRRCGNCCNVVNFILGGVVLAEDEQEYARYVTGHNCRVFGVKLEEGGPDVMAVRVPLVCRYLEYDGVTGITSCLIYETRPRFCREHFCKWARDE